jgi:hypothetical protein
LCLFFLRIKWWIIVFSGTKGTLRALYDYDARAEDDLSFKKGDLLVLLDDRYGLLNSDIFNQVGVYPLDITHYPQDTTH